MQCGIFALLGTVLGVCLTLLAKGEIATFKKQKESINIVASDDESTLAKSESQLMRQWQNLLSYGVENESKAEI
ncbi:MAG: hypothetical protein E7410_00895 [Ruminococcaceae bacterium]|nr:hypothetical protein [Oscillospiraceae bacterium]